ncbi:thiamine-monophosphate kinase [Klebsiella pneumoniae]|uniref:Thiamine-monophosphate kinase n=1 Tax=Klebsiella pneumoniae TaxID=573 RepID=A0A2X3C0Y0_KLEPN|nr:thiamine-monophosphate kinase [Klebsiella pneumoniae]
MACGEFSLIARYFDRVKSARLDVETGIGDDCALLHIPEKKTLQSAPTPWWRAITSYPISTLPTSPIKRWR